VKKEKKRKKVKKKKRKGVVLAGDIEHEIRAAPLQSAVAVYAVV
jgi:hypothetical protein